MHLVRRWRALLLWAALLLLLPACSMSVSFDTDLLPDAPATSPTTSSPGTPQAALTPATAPDATEPATQTVEQSGDLASSTPLAADADAEVVNLEEEVVRFTNEYRQTNGCSPVSLHPVLSNIAQAYAERMAQEDFFDHTAPDGSSLADRVQAAAYPYRVVGENLAAGYVSAQEVVGNWMQSEEHRQNLLNCEFQHIGVGHVFLAEDPGQEIWNHYWVQVLGAQ